MEALRGNDYTSFREMPPSQFLSLEAEPDAELSLERNSKRFREASSAKEIDWLTEVCFASYVLELVTEISSVENVEGFKEETESVILAPSEELRNANVQL